MAKILLNPGPVTLSQRVRQAVADSDYCHRETAFLDIQREVIDGLGAVYGCDPQSWATVALGGSGTTALEAMLSSIVGEADRVLVLENGVYGERLAEIARIHGIRHQSVSAPWGTSIDLQAFEETLDGGAFSYVAVVHHETTTGRLNPLRKIADISARYGAGVLADTVSSFGAEAIPFEHPALLACAGTANKCLHGIPGLAFVILKRELLNSASRPTSLYLHLPRWATAQDNNSTPFTPPVNSYLGLREALQELREQGGWPSRQSRYTTLADSVRQALERNHVAPWLEPAESSCVLRSYRIPAGLNYSKIDQGFASHGFVVYAGQGGLSDEMFRISTMGDIGDEDTVRLTAAIDSIFENR